MKDPQKIQNILDGLNRLEGVGRGMWTEAKGYHLVQAIDVKDGKITPITHAGIPLKIFVNAVTGETRIYLARLLDGEVDAIPNVPD